MNIVTFIPLFRGNGKEKAVPFKKKVLTSHESSFKKKKIFIFFFAVVYVPCDFKVDQSYFFFGIFSEFGLKYIQENGLQYPIVFVDKTGLGLRYCI